MQPKAKKPRKTFDAKQYVLGQYVANLVGIAITTPILVYVTFTDFGQGVGELFTVQAFAFVYILCFMAIQCWGAVTNTRKDYLRNKWIMALELPAGVENGLSPNPWKIILLPALIVGVIVAALTALAVPKLGQEPFHVLNVNFIAGIPLFAASSIVIGVLLPRDQTAYTAALARTRMSLAPFRRYLLIEHILPWALIQGTINFAIGLKQFTNEAHKLGGDIPILTSAQDAGIVAVIIVFFMWLSSMTQVRPDVYLGRVSQDDRKAPSVPLMLLIVLSFLGFGAVVWVVLALAGFSTISPLSAAGLKAGVAMTAVIPGCALGVWWGKRRETALIRKMEPSEDRDNKVAQEIGAST